MAAPNGLARRSKKGGGTELFKYLNTLALAQHRTGDTAKAIETQKRTLGLIPPEYNQERKQFEQRLAEYEAALAADCAPIHSPSP